MPLKVNGLLCGDVNAPVPGGVLSIRHHISDPDEPNAEYAIQVFRDAVGDPAARMVTSVSTEAGGGDGVVEDVAIGTAPQYIFFKVIQFSEDGSEEYAWMAPVWFQDRQDETILLHDGGGSETDDQGSAVSGAAVASRRSNTFHASARCFDAQRISPQNLVRGAEARSGRRLHPGCPRLTGPR